MNESLGVIVGLVLTLLIYSYIIRDNPLYRLAVHVLVGVSAAYSAVIVVQQVIVPVINQIRQNPTDRASLLWVVPLIFVLLLILKQVPSLTWLGNNALALLVGVGAAVALVGALMGTLWTQVTAVSNSNALPFQRILVAVITGLTLLSFQFTGDAQNGMRIQSIWRRGVSQIGRLILAITFGALFAALLNTSVILLSSRLGYYLTQLGQLMP